MNMLASRGAVPADEPPKPKKKETSPPNPLGGGGIAAAAAAAAQKKAKQKEEGGEEANPPDPRAALMSMLASRAPPIPSAAEEQKKESDNKPTPPPPPNPLAGGGIAAAAAAAVQKKNKQKEEESSDEPPQHDPRAALMSMLASRAPPVPSDEPKPKKEEGKEEANPDPRTALMSMLNKRAPPTPAAVESTKPEKKEEEANPDPRSALMSMLNKRAPPTPAAVESESSSVQSSSSKENNSPAQGPISPPSNGELTASTPLISNKSRSGKKKKKSSSKKSKSKSKRNSSSTKACHSTLEDEDLLKTPKQTNKSPKHRKRYAFSLEDKDVANIEMNDVEQYLNVQIDEARAPPPPFQPPPLNVVPDVKGPVDMDDYVDYNLRRGSRSSGLGGSLMSVDEDNESLTGLSPVDYNNNDPSIPAPRNLEMEDENTHTKAAEVLLRVIETKQLDIDSIISNLKTHKNNQRKLMHQAGSGRGSLAGLQKIQRSVSLAQMHNPIDMDDFSADDTSVNSDYSNLSTISANHRRIAKNSQKLASHIMNTPQDKFTAVNHNVALKDDPEYSIYFRMLRYGFTIGAVRAALQRDGKPDITRLDPDKPVYLQRVPKVAATLAPKNIDAEIDALTEGLGRGMSTEVEGLEFNDEGLTNQGWESALETARQSSGVKSPSYRKSNSGGLSPGSISGGRESPSIAKMAVKSIPPWLQSNVERGIVEGWLRKRTRRGRWVRRWYLIDSTGIYYSHSPPTSSSKVFSKKPVKLVDARCLGAKKIIDNPIEFEVWHPSQNKAVVALRANSAHEMQQWVDAINATSERQRVVDEVVVGSVIPENLVKNTVGMIEGNNAAHNSGYNNAHYQPLPPSAIGGGRTSPSDSRFPLPDKNKKLKTVRSEDELSSSSDESSSDEEGSESEDDSSEEAGVLSPDSMDKFQQLLTEGSLPNDINAQELSDRPKRPRLERQNSWPPLSLMSDGTIGAESVPAKSKEEVEADLKRIEEDIKRLDKKEEEGPANPTEIEASGGGGGKGDGKGGDGDGSGEKKEGDGDGEPKLQDDPKYDKYFKMMKMGLPKEVAKHAMSRDQMDPSILDLDPEKSLKSQLAPAEGDGGPPLKDDPKYIKYYKMMKMGLPKDAVKHAMARDQLDPSILDLDPEKSLKSQTESADDTGPPLKEDPKYIKYFKMMKMGLPKEAAKHAMTRDGLDSNILDMDPEKSLKSQTEKKDAGPPLKDDPKYGKSHLCDYLCLLFCCIDAELTCFPSSILTLHNSQILQDA